MQGLSQDGQESILNVYFLGDESNPQPTGSDFRIRLANSLLLRLSGTLASNWDVSGNETVTGDSSGDSGTLYGARDNGDGTVTLRLGDIGETDVFQKGESVTGGSSSESGTIDNANLNLSSLSGGYFLPNEEIADQSTGATADVKKVAGEVIEINNISGDFGTGNTVEGKESGVTATIEKSYPGFPGLFKENSLSNLLGEPSNYNPVTLSADSTGWTQGEDAAGNKYVRSAEVQFSSTDTSNLGPINQGVLTVEISTDAEILLGVAPIKGSPPSKVISSDGTVTFQYEQTLT